MRNKQPLLLQVNQYQRQHGIIEESSFSQRKRALENPLRHRIYCSGPWLLPDCAFSITAFSLLSLSIRISSCFCIVFIRSSTESLCSSSSFWRSFVGFCIIMLPTALYAFSSFVALSSSSACLRASAWSSSCCFCDETPISWFLC